MSTPVKIGVAVITICLLILISLVILIKVVVTPEKVRDTLVPMAEDALSRQVEIGDIEIGILSGVSLKDLKVSDKGSADEFISIKTLALHYQLLALLSGNLIVDQVLLEQPKISVVRNPDGSFNFSDLLDLDSSKDDLKENGESKSGSEDAGSRALDLLISEVSVTGGELRFVDRMQNPKSPYRFLLNQLDFQAQQITLDGSFPIALAAQINGSQLELSGDYDIKKQSGAFDVNLAALDLLQFTPYYREAIPGTLSSALLGMKLEVNILPVQIESKGTVSLDNIDLRLNDLPEAELNQAKLSVEHSLQFQLEPQQLQLSSLLLDFNGIRLGAEGAVNLAGSEPQLALALLLDKFDLATVMSGAPKGLVKDFQSYRVSGLIDGRVELAGVPSAGAKLLKSAQLDLTKVQVNVDTLQAGLSGGIKLAAEKVHSENLLLHLNDQQLNLNLNAENVFGKVIKGSFKVTADQLDVNRILPEAAEEPPEQQPVVAEGAGDQDASAAEELGPFDIPLDMTGQLQVKNMLYKQLTLRNVTADMTLKDNRLKISQLRSEIAGGEFVASSDVNLAVKGFEYQGQLSLQQSKLVELISGLVPQAEQSVTGLLQWSNDFSGKGTIPKQLLKTLQLKGDLTLHEGQITGSPLLEQLAGFLGSPDLKVLSFSGLQSQYELRDGLAKLTGDLDSSKAKLKPEGTIGVDGSLNMGLDARLAPEVMQRLGSKIPQALTDENGWTMLPLKIKGSYDRPKIGFDTKALQKQATGKIKQEVSKKILDKIAPTGTGEGDAGKDLLDGTLKKFFGN